MKKDNVEGLTRLGSKTTKYIYTHPTPELLETFPNQFPNRDYCTEFIFNEFTSLCPKTGQPDFAKIHITYVADEKCIETKSLKLYLLSYRMYGSFMETITNQILEDLVNACKPRKMKVRSEFNVRGGTAIIVEAEFKKE